MSDDTIQSFLDALGRLEADGDVEPIVALFGDDAVLQNVTVAGDFHGQDGARHFWSDDRRVFGEVSSEFRNVIVDGDRAALEWTRRGTSRGGDPIEYPGVSILELAGGRISRFMAYFHPRELGRQAT